MAENRKSMIIIGAGLGGLACGCYAQMNGYESTIFEMHTLPGGCCTSWKRKDYVFDWCISWMLGTGADNQMNQIWMELGALQNKKITNFDVFNTVIGRNGEKVHFYVDPDRLREHLTTISPQDSVPIERFCKDLSMFQKIVNSYPFLKPIGLMGFWERIRMFAGFLPYLRRVMKTHNLLMEDFSKQFKHPFLSEAMNYIFFDRRPTFPLLPFYFSMAAAANLNAGVPEGGSIGVAESIEDRFIQLGGQIRYKSKVDKILVENNQAVGIRLKDGTEHFADIVLSACDAHYAVEHLLDGRYKDKTIRKLFNELIDKPQQIYKGWTAVFLGVDMDLKDNAAAYHSASYILTDEEAKQLPGGISKNISVMIRNKQYSDMCPKGKSVILVSFFSETGFWEKLNEEAPEHNGKGRVYTSRKRSDRYKDAKERVAKFIVNYLDNHFPGVKEKVECVDVATPLTLIRYTGNYKGSILAWEPFNEAGELMEEYVKKNGPTLPGLSNFYLSGHWMSTGGVIRTVSAARHSLHFICRDDKKKFRANIPKEAPLACKKRWTRKYKPKEILKRIPA